MTTPYFSKVSISVEGPTDTPAVATVLRGMKTFTVTCYDERTSTNTAHTIIIIIIYTQTETTTATEMIRIPGRRQLNREKKNVKR